MRKCDVLTRLYSLILYVFLIAYGCASPALNMPNPRPDIIKEYKSIRVEANDPFLSNTGIYIEKGEIYSILAKGNIQRWPSGPWQGPGSKLLMLIGKKIVSHNGYDTKKSEHSGEIKLGVHDGPFNYKTGQSDTPKRYKDNLGQFHVDIIIWKTNSYSQIAEFFANMKKEDPENIVIQAAFGYLNQYEKIELARKETSGEIEKTRKQLHELIDKSQTQNISSTEPTQQNKAIIEIESKLAQLMKTLEQLDEMKMQLEEERRKTNQLSKKLEAKEEKEKQLLSQIAHFSKRPAGLLISSPEDGKKTEGANVLLTGVAEDDNGLREIKIFINNKPFAKTDERGIKVTGKAFPKRFYINETIPLAKGKNQIKIKVINLEGLLSEKMLLVYRVERKRKIWAVIVGINDYNKVPKLKYAVNDAKSFYDLMVGVNKIPEENVKLLVDEKATLKNLRSILGTHLKNKAGKEDMVIIYFAGHGATENDIMSPDGDGLEKYLLTSDTNPNDLYASALPMRELSHILKRIRSERLIFIVDSCYSGSSGGRTINSIGYRANLSDAFLDRISSGKGKIILTASGANEVSAEFDELQHGVFTYYLLEGLSGMADIDNDRLISVDEVYKYVSEHVPQATHQEQHPVKKGTIE